MEVDELVSAFFALEYCTSSDMTFDLFDCYSINGAFLEIEYHTKNGDKRKSTFTIWEVVAALLMSYNQKNDHKKKKG
jgi:hypothetical protein